MSTSRGSPSHRRYSPFRCEEGVVVNVNKRDFTIDCLTRHTDKEVNDIQILAPYHHFQRGEGMHHLPEVGAKVMLAWPSDNTPPFIMGYKAAAAVAGNNDETGQTTRSTTQAETPANNAVSFRSNRPDLQPGDIAFTTRDENFIYLRRGGVVQIGSTPIAQRLYIPVLNYVKDFCENYNISTFGGDITWTVERQENDPAGDAPATYVFHMNEFAQDAKASVRIRHLPLAEPGGGEKAAWDVVVAAQNIDRDTGEFSSETYTLSVLMDGSKTEFMGASREITVQGDDTLTVQGKRTVNVSSDEEHNVDGKLILVAGPQAVLEATGVYLGNRNASEPAVLGQQLYTWLAGLTLPVSGSTAGPPSVPPPTSILSRVVKVK